MIQESIERMNELIDILNDANYNYYVKDNPTITDQEFDKYLRELETIEKNHPDWNIKPEIMIPLVGEVKELKYVKKFVLNHLRKLNILFLCFL